MNTRNFKNMSVGKGIKRPSSKNMEGIKTSLPKIKKEILDCKVKQSKLANQIKDDIKKIRETNISISGLEQISPKSIEKIHAKRTKSILHLTSLINELNAMVKNITKLESKYKKNLEK